MKIVWTNHAVQRCWERMELDHHEKDMDRFDTAIKKNIMISGTLNHDGSIGPVSSVLEKAKAAKDVGATVFLVPLLQSRDVVYETKQHCEKFGSTEICTSETIPKKIDVSAEAGISIIEVSNIADAVEYFFED